MARSYLPPGFRFHPTDEELLAHYLRRKVAGKKLDDGVIGEIDVYKFEPADLPGLATLQSRDPEWFFFNAQDKKYLRGARINRTTETGYWKATGKDRKICSGSCTGLKKTLIFYSGRAPHGKRTDWVMHEYRLDEEFEKKMNCTKSFVLCRIRRKGGLGPRNGEQYGAPVLEANEDNEGNLPRSYHLEEACVLPFADAKIAERQVLELPHAATDEVVALTDRAGGGDDIDSFLQTLISYEQTEQRVIQDEVFSLEEILGLPNNLSDFAVMELAQGGPMGHGFGVLEDKLCDILHPDNNEPSMLEDMLRCVSGEVKVSDGFTGGRALQEYSYEQGVVNVDNAGFIELADLEEPCDEQGTLECCDIEGLLYELEYGAEIPMSARLAQERLQGQSLHSFGDRQSPRGSQRLGASGMVNEQLASEVPRDSSQGLSVLDSIYTRLLTSDDGGGFSDDLPSGFVLNEDQEGEFTGSSVSSMAHSHPHSSRADGSSEDQMVRIDSLPEGVNLDMQDGSHLVASVSQEETKVAGGEGLHIHSKTTEQSLQQLNPTAGLPMHINSFVGSSSSNPSSPSTFARVLSGVLGKVNVLPASAAELPDSFKYSSAGKETSKSALIHGSSSSTSGSLPHFRFKLIDSVEQTARTPEMELQFSVSRAVSGQVSTKPCRSFANGLSLFLFRIIFIALICFCRFQGICRSTRIAIF